MLRRWQRILCINVIIVKKVFVKFYIGRKLFLCLSNAYAWFFNHQTSWFPVALDEDVSIMQKGLAGLQMFTVHLCTLLQRTNYVSSHCDAMEICRQVIMSSGEAEAGGQLQPFRGTLRQAILWQGLPTFCQCSSRLKLCM